MSFRTAMARFYNVCLTLPKDNLLYNIQCRGLRQLVLPPSYEGVKYPERNKLRFVERTPQYPPGLRPPKMQKNLRFMRGPEEIQNNLIHKQYGIIGQGKRMGGGKGAIDHYVTPIKHGRVIVEMGGHCEFEEVRPILREVAHKLPFKAIVVSHDTLQEMRLKEKQLEESNINPYDFKYVVRNNMGKSHLWVSPSDRKYFGKHI